MEVATYSRSGRAARISSQFLDFSSVAGVCTDRRLMPAPALGEQCTRGQPWRMGGTWSRSATGSSSDNVFVGLRAETTLEDVFAVYEWKDGTFSSCSLDLIRGAEYEADFRNLYRFYRRTVFAKFSVIGPHLYMIFRVGRDVTDIKAFKWLIRGDTLQYVDARSEHECVYPSQHQFEWRRTTQDMFRQGKNPHISIDDRIFVETMGGDNPTKTKGATL
jgi:hypothetical protein